MLPGMMGRALISCAAVAALAVSDRPARAANEPVRLAPSSKWHVEYSEDSCRLARQFGKDKQTSLVVIERFAPGDDLRLTVTGRAFRTARSGKDATLRFGPAENEQQVSFMSGEWGDAPALIFARPLRIAPISEKEAAARERLEQTDQLHLFEPAPISLERERATTFLSVDAPGTPEILFETGSLGEPFAALRKCMDELLTHWGINVERHKSLARKAVPTKSPGTWLKSSDYPSSLLRKGAQGIVNFRLSVDREGKVSDCHIQRSTRPEGFDKAVCDALMRRAEFTPALDAEANPIASYYISSARFVMG